MDVEGIGEAHEKIEKRSIIDGLRDLGVAPPSVAQSLDLLVRDPIGVPGQRFDEFQQQAMLGREAGGVEIPVAQGRGGPRVLLTLQLQEPCMAAESIVAAVERGDVRGDHLVLSATEGPIPEVEPARLIDSAQEVGT
jgi:hypothetical protein